MSKNYWVLDIPWGTRFPDVKYYSQYKVNVYYGESLPEYLRPYVTPDFSYGQFIQSLLNKRPALSAKSDVIYKPREHQVEGAKAIYKAWMDGWSGFLLSDKTGVGKTLTSLVALSAIAKKSGFNPEHKGKVLIVCPKGVIPQWRQTLHNYPTATASLQPLIINYQQLNKLIDTPKAAKKAKKTRTKNRATAKAGTPKIDFDFIVFDEAHYLKNYPSSSVSLAACNIAHLEKSYSKGKSPFVIFSTATPGASPLNFSVMSNFMSRLLSPNLSTGVYPSNWGKFLEMKGFAVKEGKTGWTWASVPWFGKNSDDPAERRKYEQAVKNNEAVQRKDALKIGKALKTPGAPFLMRSPKDIAGWPEQQIIPMPIELDSSGMAIYNEAWMVFRKFLKLTPAHSNPQGALVENLRYRQKVSLLKVDTVIDNIANWVDSGAQVFVSCEFIETLEKYKEQLSKLKISTCEISGRTNSVEREKERLRFQKGAAKVCLCTVVAGISLHANETLPDGSKATSAPRITVIADIRQNNLDTTQACGRCHRDGENSIVYIPHIANTIDEKVVYSFVNKDTNMKTMIGDEAGIIEGIYRKFLD